MVNNWLFEGRVFHERLKPFNHKFVYNLFFLRFPISKLKDLENRFLSFDKFNLFSFHTKDYLDGSDRSLEEKIREVFLKEDLDVSGEIYLQTLPRLLGYGFNPVSFWFAYDKEKKLMAIMSEVNNTFGDRHYYLLQNFSEYKKITTKKVFHVSPFFDIKGDYQFSFNPKSVTINYLDNEAGNTFFTSTFVEDSSREYNAKNLLKIFFKYPFMSFMVMVRIHWQALRLFLKKAQFYKRPNPPKELLTKEVNR